MKKLPSIILQIIIAVVFLMVFGNFFNGLVFTFWLFIFWMTSTKVEQPTHSPIAWLFCGLVTIVICGIDAYSWWQILSNPYWTDLDVEYQKEITDLHNQNFRTALMQCGIGFMIMCISGWKLIKTKSEPVN